MILAIGDVHGCADALDALLTLADPDQRAALWWVGDLVNRGPDSVGTLRRICALGARATVVLGNHDLYWLSLAAQPNPTAPVLTALMTAPDGPELLAWLRHRPLAHRQGKCLMVHAGLFPAWSTEQARALAHEVEAILQGPDWADFLRVMAGNTPDYWDDTLSGDDRLRAIINGLTRIRLVTADGRMDFNHPGPPATAPTGLIPWFEAPTRRSAQDMVIFGHWSALGLVQRPHLLGLDSGCVWGGPLTAVDLNHGQVFQVPGRQPHDQAVAAPDPAG